MDLFVTAQCFKGLYFVVNRSRNIKQVRADFEAFLSKLLEAPLT